MGKGKKTSATLQKPMQAKVQFVDAAHGLDHLSHSNDTSCIAGTLKPDVHILVCFTMLTRDKLCMGGPQSFLFCWY